MTFEEQEQFKNKILEVIMPIAINMTDEQIKAIVTNVENENENIPKGFANMLHEQIIILKQENFNTIK